MRIQKLLQYFCWVSMVVAGTGGVHAEKCFNVAGSVDTVNVSQINQQGTINLLVYGENFEDEQFNKSGDIFGTIVPCGDDVASFGVTCLTHDVNFGSSKRKSGSGFTTENDLAYFLNVLRTTEEGVPCAFSVHEDITHLTNGSGIFKKTITRAHINVEGVVSFCPNANHFDLSGWYCQE